ncbi:Methyltransferase type 11 [Chondromyces apiculatus DSM 436]|uniref:Methyltransferase type 11 n=2 Tax=Chondromyces apiculatus TaxID=51 RepID=A0A017T9Z0_9BACT|nr:Methyltransferase type 11 [Chondromyces apiculatus DSM 436]
MTPESTKKDEVAAAYDRWSVVYDGNENPTRDLDAVVLRRQTFPLASRDVLEVGCGTGKNTAWLAEHARSVTAMDFSEGMLAQARQRVSAAHVRYVQHDVREAWPLADGAVDLVVGNLVLEHVEALEGVFKEAFRVLRPGGEYYLCELHPFRQILGKQARFTSPETGETVLVQAYVHDVSEYVQAALEAGFRIVGLEEWRDGEGKGEVPRLLALRCRREG